MTSVLTSKPPARRPNGRLPARAPRVHWGQICLVLLCTAVLAFLILPTVLVVLMSVGREEFLQIPPTGLTLRWYAEYFTDPDWIDSTLFSLRIAVLTALVSTVIGTAAALALARGHVPARGWVNTAVMSPLIVPHVIVAIAIYSLFVRLQLNGTLVGFVLAHSMLAVPTVVLTVSAALARFDPMMELAALSLGASRLVAMRRVTVPLALPGIVGGALFAFVSSFDEATVAFFISSVSDKTLTKKLFEDIDFNVSPVVAAVSTLITAFSLLVMASFQLARLRRAGQRNRAGD